MKDERRNNNNPDASQDVTTPSPKTQKGEKKNKPADHADKSSGNYKKSFRRSWRATGAVPKLGIIVGGIGAAAAVGYLIVFIWQAWHTRPLPLIVNYRPPKLLQPPLPLIAAKR